MAGRRKKKLKVEDMQEEQEKKPLMSFPEACILVTTVALILGIAMILVMSNARFG